MTQDTSHNSVSIIGGTGDLGFGLAVRLASAGVPFSIGSRQPAKAEQAAERVRESVPDAAVGHGGNADVAGQADIVVITVPFAAHAATIAGLTESLRPGQVFVDATVPLETAIGGKPTRTISVWAGSAAQQAKRLVPDGVGIVSALHTVSATSLTDLTCELDEDVLICGDDRADKQRVSALVAQIAGLRPVDAGRLEISHVVEQLTALMISINIRHKTHAGIRITGLADRVPATPGPA